MGESNALTFARGYRLASGPVAVPAIFQIGGVGMTRTSDVHRLWVTALQAAAVAAWLPRQKNWCRWKDSNLHDLSATRF